MSTQLSVARTVASNLGFVVRKINAGKTYESVRPVDAVQLELIAGAIFSALSDKLGKFNEPLVRKFLFDVAHMEERV